MAEQTVSLNPGESQVVSFKVTPSEAREYLVAVDGLQGGFVASEAPAAVFEYTSEFTLTKVSGSSTRNFAVSVKNTSDITGDLHFYLYRRMENPYEDNYWSAFSQKYSETITIQPGEESETTLEDL